MATRSKRPCAASGCYALVERGYCPAHTHRADPEPARRFYDDRRGSSARRGYDADWKRFRAEFLADNEWCADCRAARTPRDTRATCVHHIRKVRERPDLRLVRANCRGLCKPCHDGRTARGE